MLSFELDGRARRRERARPRRARHRLRADAGRHRHDAEAPAVVARTAALTPEGRAALGHHRRVLPRLGRGRGSRPADRGDRAAVAAAAGAGAAPELPGGDRQVGATAALTSRTITSGRAGRRRSPCRGRDSRAARRLRARSIASKVRASSGESTMSGRRARQQTPRARSWNSAKQTLPSAAVAPPRAPAVASRQAADHEQPRLDRCGRR